MNKEKNKVTKKKKTQKISKVKKKKVIKKSTKKKIKKVPTAKKSSKKKTKLNEKQKLFCQLYATDREFFGNGVQAYIKAYNINLSKSGAYNGARTDAYRLLTKAYILEYIRKIMELGGLNNERVDKELLFLIEQDAEFGTKLGAIKEYNKLKDRIENKLKLEGDVTYTFKSNIKPSPK